MPARVDQPMSTFLLLLLFELELETKETTPRMSRVSSFSFPRAEWNAIHLSGRHVARPINFASGFSRDLPGSTLSFDQSPSETRQGDRHH